jgi:ATP-dependent DNA helicase PIF1
MLPTKSRTYKSVDVVMDPSQALLYQVEFLISLETTTIAPRNLQLKVGVPIFLLRNLAPPELCNGTRLCVKYLYSHLIEATILTGCAKGRNVFIPRIPLIPTDLAFDFKRIEFSVRFAFAMSINKAQGQSLKIAGIHLRNPCFSHGRLYVACSRVGHQKKPVHSGPWRKN